MLTAHGRSRREAEREHVEVLAEVGLAAARAEPHAPIPHEFSGGMRQRVVIAMALALRPQVLIADEPTTALDVTIQQQIIALVSSLQEQMAMGVIWVTHDLGVVARVAERTMVMYGGRIVEVGPTARVFGRPEHPYTAGLLAAIPPVRGQSGTRCGRSPAHRRNPGEPRPDARSDPRCPYAVEQCQHEMPPLTDRGGSQAACWVPPEQWTTRARHDAAADRSGPILDRRRI